MIIVLIFSGAPLLGEATLAELLALGPAIGLAFVIPTAAGLIATGLCLLLFGSVIARVSRPFLESSAGVAFAVGSALAVSLLIGGTLTLPSGELQAALLICLPYALPAAILYRREIRLESAFT